MKTPPSPQPQPGPRPRRGAGSGRVTPKKTRTGHLHLVDSAAPDVRPAVDRAVPAPRRRPNGAARRALTSGRGITRSTPAYPGSVKRVERSFDCDAWADRWLADCNIALHTDPFPGLPDADDYRPGGRIRTAAQGTRPIKHGGHSLGEALDTWADKEYFSNRRASPARKHKIRADINAIQAYFGERITDVSQLEVEDVEGFISHMAGDQYLPPPDPSAPVPERTVPEGVSGAVAVDEAARLVGKHKSSIKRALLHRELPGAYKVDTRRGPETEWRIPIADLFLAGFTVQGYPPPPPTGGRTMPAGTGISLRHAQERLTTLKRALKYARAKRWMTHDPTEGLVALEPAPALAATRKPLKEPNLIELDEAKMVASHLDLKWQLALWLTRILGLRISEVFGLNIGDFVDWGDVGILFVGAPGGKGYEILNRWLQIEHVTCKEDP